MSKTIIIIIGNCNSSQFHPYRKSHDYFPMCIINENEWEEESHKINDITKI